jgi:excisionase family DNA binding protein
MKKDHRAPFTVPASISQEQITAAAGTLGLQPALLATMLKDYGLLRSYGRVAHQSQLSQKPVLTVLEASRLLGVSKNTLYRLIKDGTLPHHKTEGRTLLLRADIDYLLNQTI